MFPSKGIINILARTSHSYVLVAHLTAAHLAYLAPPITYQQCTQVTGMTKMVPDTPASRGLAELNGLQYNLEGQFFKNEV